MLDPKPKTDITRCPMQGISGPNKWNILQIFFKKICTSLGILDHLLYLRDMVGLCEHGKQSANNAVSISDIRGAKSFHQPYSWHPPFTSIYYVIPFKHRTTTISTSLSPERLKQRLPNNETNSISIPQDIINSNWPNLGPFANLCLRFFAILLRRHKLVVDHLSSRSHWPQDC